MFIEDTGIVLTVRPFHESSLLVRCFLSENGIYSGLWRINRKQIADVILGNVVRACWTARVAEQLGYYSFELVNNVTASAMRSHLHIVLIHAAVSMVHGVLNEREIQPTVFAALSIFLHTIADQLLSRDMATSIPNMQQCDIVQLIKLYIELEMELLRRSGFGLDLSKCAATGSLKELVYVSPRSGCAVSRKAGIPYHDRLLPLPQWLIKQHSDISGHDIISCFNLLEFFLNKHIFSSMRKKIPQIRTILMSTILKKLHYNCTTQG